LLHCGLIYDGLVLVSVGDINARCKDCGGTDFKVVKPGTLRLTSLMACTACDRVTTYLDLLDDIGEQAMQRANESLTKLKRNGPRGPKPKK
jgi:hypothetical protein